MGPHIAHVITNKSMLITPLHNITTGHKQGNHCSSGNSTTPIASVLSGAPQPDLGDYQPGTLLQFIQCSHKKTSLIKEIISYLVSKQIKRFVDNFPSKENATL